MNSHDASTRTDGLYIILLHVLIETIVCIYKLPQEEQSIFKLACSHKVYTQLHTFDKLQLLWQLKCYNFLVCLTKTDVYTIFVKKVLFRI